MATPWAANCTVGGSVTSHTRGTGDERGQTRSLPIFRIQNTFHPTFARLAAWLDALPVPGYRDQIARTDAIIARLDLDDRSHSRLRGGEHPTLRWVVLHLVEENARHNGHLDLLREIADGTRGD